MCQHQIAYLVSNLLIKRCEKAQTMGVRSDMNAQIFAAIALYVLTITDLRAENGCPAGYEPWKIPVESASDCFAIPNYGQQNSQLPSQTVPSGPQWATRWGAIAIGSTASGGGVGVVTDMKNQRAAEKAALKQCKSRGGGKSCRIEISYADQCAAIAWGDRFYNTARAETVELASDLSLAACSKKTENCKIYYANCALPVRVK